MARISIKPLDDRLVVEQNEAEEKTAGGIVLPDQAKEKPTRGKVVAAGPGKMLETGNRAPMCVKVGNDVLYGKYSGTEIDLNGKKYTVIRETDVLGVMER